MNPMIDMKLFLELMGAPAYSARLTQNEQPAFLDNRIINESGIKAVSIDDHTFQLLTDDEREQLDMHENHSLLSFPCSLTEFRTWVINNGYEDLIDISKLENVGFLSSKPDSSGLLGTPVPKSTSRVSELHELIHGVDLHLQELYGKKPSSKTVWNELEKNHNQYDSLEIIDEITAVEIFWTSSHGNRSKLKLSSFSKTLSNIRSKYRQ